MTDIALPWLILLQTHSATDAALVTAARYLPIVALGLTAGIIADRVDRRFLMIASDLGRALGLALVVALGIAHQNVPLWFLVIVVLALGIGQLLFQVAYRAWLPDVTSDKLLADATAMLEASDAISTLTGPALGGALIQAVGPAVALGADATSYLVSAATLAPLRAAPAAAETSPPPPLQKRKLWSEALEGGRFILRSPEQRLLSAMGTAIYMSSASIGVLIALLAQVTLRLPAWQAGLIFASAGAGGLLGSALAPRLMERLGWQRSLAVAFLVAAIGALGFALAVVLDEPTVSGFVIALLANLVLDGAVSLSFIITGTTSTLLTPRELRGRVNAVGTMYTSAVRGLSLVAVGALTASDSPLFAFLLLAGCFLCAAAAPWLTRTARVARL